MGTTFVCKRVYNLKGQWGKNNITEGKVHMCENESRFRKRQDELAFEDEIFDVGIKLGIERESVICTADATWPTGCYTYESVSDPGPGLVSELVSKLVFELGV